VWARAFERQLDPAVLVGLEDAVDLYAPFGATHTQLSAVEGLEQPIAQRWRSHARESAR
jgi:hypothetical protein